MGEGAGGGGELFGVVVLVVEPVADLVGGQPGEQQVGAQRTPVGPWSTDYVTS